jgi:hypothetical protein
VEKKCAIAIQNIAFNFGSAQTMEQEFTEKVNKVRFLKVEEILDEIIEEIRKKLDKELEPWWSYSSIKKVSGYLGIPILMALYKFGPFDKTCQWIKTSGSPRSSFYFYRKDLIDRGLITSDGKKLTSLGKKVCEYLESSGRVISGARFYEIVESVRSARSKYRR